eukprot:Amastigsp_a339951_77.p2 type:complete len:539 gc:universal Amastigsp_a339951_77:1-1617(+)
MGIHHLQMSAAPHGSATDTSVVTMFNPATMAPLGKGSVRATTRDEVIAAVARGRAAQKQWAKSTFAQRNAVLNRIRRFILDHQTEICELSMKDSGKTLMDAHYGELFPVLEKIQFLLNEGEAGLSPEQRSSGSILHKVGTVFYQPLGVIGILAPFNWPFHNIMCPVLPVLYAGNAAVIKVSEWTTYSCDYYGSILKDALVAEGFSADLVQFVVGWGDVGASLISSGVDKIFFTGSPENGRRVMAEAAKTLTPVVLELGGKDPMIICEDANFDHAVAQAMLGIFTSCGQMCVGTERFYVHESIYDAFVGAVVARVKSMSQGPPEEMCHDIGAMTMPRQLDIIEGLVNDALASGARALVGGRRKPGKGLFWEPTVLVDVNHTMRIMREEHFGPVMVIMKWSTDDEVIELANDCPYGLGASVFTRNAARGQRIAEALVSGMCVINDYGISYVCQSLPFGGVKISGIGRINGVEGLRECTRTKAILSDRFPFTVSMPRAWQYPIAQKDGVELAQRMIRLIYGASLWEKTKAAVSMVPMLSKL